MTTSTTSTATTRAAPKAMGIQLRSGCSSAWEVKACGVSSSAMRGFYPIGSIMRSDAKVPP